MATVELRYDPKDTAWFTANATMILKAGEPAYHATTGQFKLGDGTTQLSALPFLPATGGGGSGVPYTGATGDVDLGEYELKAGQIELDQTPTGTAGVAVTRWNTTHGLTETTLTGGNVVIKNGVDLVARVVNKVTPNTTLTKAQYQVVKISGAQGQRLAVGLAQSNNDNNSADTLGVAIETIPTNQEGFIMTMGQLEGINTTGSLQGETWADGDVLYLSPTTAGAITKVKPNGSTGHIVVVGYVEYAHANNGKIYVKVMNGWELDELHNVYINNPANNEVLTYESATSLWKNKAISTGLTTGITTIASGTNTNILYNNSGVLGEYSTTGTGTTAVLSTSPTFVTYITTPKLIGGTGVTSKIEYFGTSGNGTSTAAAHEFKVGNNGATTAITILNNGNIGIGGVTAPASRLHIGTAGNFHNIQLGYSSVIGGNVAGTDIGNNGSNATGFFMPTTAQGDTILSGVALEAGRGLKLRFYRSFFEPFAASSQAITAFTFTTAANTGQTASINIPNFQVTGNTKTWAAGTITNQYWNYFTANTASFVGASTMTNSYGLFVESAIAGTNATITNNYAFGTNGKAKFGGNIELTQTVTTESLTSDTSVTIVINGTTYKLLAKA